MEWFFRAIGQASLSPKKADCGYWKFMLRSLNKKVSWAPHQKQRKNTKHLLATKHVWRWRRKKMAKQHRKKIRFLHDDFLSPFGPPGCRTCLGIDSSCTFHKHETVEIKWKKLDLLPVKLRHKSSSLFNVFAHWFSIRGAKTKKTDCWADYESINISSLNIPYAIRKTIYQAVTKPQKEQVLMFNIE